MNKDNDKFLDRVNNSITNSSKEKSRDIFDLQTLFAQRKDMLWKVLHERYKYNTSIKRGQTFLLNHIDSKIPLIVIYADLVGSTKMSMQIPVEKMGLIIKVFSHEISSVVESFEGYILKYVGDAVIAFFPIGFNRYLSCDKSFNCCKSMINVIENGINPIFVKEGYPKLSVKISMDEGENLALQYGFDKSAPIDLIGYPMNVAAKMNSLTNPNKITVGNNIFKFLHPAIQKELHNIPLDTSDWKYFDSQSNLPYQIFTT